MEQYLQFVEEVLRYVSGKKASDNQKYDSKKFYRVFLGIGPYPDKSNLFSTCGLYKNAGEVAFFSSKAKPELLFVFAILFGSNDQAYKFVEYMYSRTSHPSISLDDVIEFLAITRGIYFKNLYPNFGVFEKNLKPKSTLYLLFSTDKRHIQTVKNCQSYKDCANVIHPTSKNMNSIPLIWFPQYILNTFHGAIGQSSLTYQQFQI